jgi:hypothetical protein
MLLESMPNRFNVPDRAAEAADPAGADSAYEVIVGALRELTRDRKSFPLVYAENVEYGFRRNLRAMRRAGVCLAALTVIACLGAGIPLGLLLMHGSALVFLAPGACATLALALWSRATDEWVRLPAEAYAERLLGAVERLAQPMSGR